MFSSLAYMLAAVRLGRLITPNAQSLQYKQALFVISILSTVGLVIFFLKHRLLCHDMGEFFNRIYSSARIDSLSPFDDPIVKY